MKKNKNINTVENELYLEVKKYISLKANIIIEHIDKIIAKKISANGKSYWDDFMILFTDISSNKEYILQNNVLKVKNS